MSEAIRTLVVDDEAPARELLCDLLGVDPEIDVVGACASGRSAIQSAAELRAQLIMLDVQMPGMTGIEVARRLGRASQAHIVFVTAHDRYAVDAFELEALDYLLKPIDKARLASCLRRAKARVRSTALSGFSEEILALARRYEQPPSAAAPTGEEEIVVRHGTRLRAIAVEDITLIESANQYVTIHSTNGSDVLCMSLSALHERLDPRRFVRVHRSAVVNIAAVREVRRAGNGGHCLVTHDGRTVRVSRYRRDVVPRLVRAVSRASPLRNVNA